MSKGQRGTVITLDAKTHHLFYQTRHIALNKKPGIGAKLFVYFIILDC